MNLNKNKPWEQVQGKVQQRPKLFCTACSTLISIILQEHLQTFSTDMENSHVLMSPKHTSAANRRKRSHWEVIKWKEYGWSVAGTGKEGKGCPGIPPPHGFRHADSLGIKVRGQALNKAKVSQCWRCGVGPVTISPGKHSNTLTELLTLPLLHMSHGRQAACKCRALKFFDLWQANSARSQWLIWWDPICLGSSKFLLLTKILSSFSERQSQGR